MTHVSPITSERTLAAVVERLASAAAIALDVEADGLFAYRAKLCVVQLAWENEGEMEVAIIDPLAVDIMPLARVLSADGPPKVLHDLSFDARMLGETGIDLGNVRDTSVAARFLGEQATGLARMVESRLGVVLSKDLQDHNWSKRPLGPDELRYLAADVEHLLALDAVLDSEVHARGIAEEVELECRYKLETARLPPRDDRPLHARIKGFGEIDPVARAVLRRLVEAREVLAEAANVPPFRIVRNELLLEVARRKPASEGDLLRLLGRDRAARHLDAWQRAVALGRNDDPEPKPPAPEPPADLAERRKLEKHLTGWRRDEAESRGVDPQVVVPGHCMGPVVSALLACGDDRAALETQLDAIAGFGRFRVERYGAALERSAAELSRTKA